jgi:hypothetical protein
MFDGCSSLRGINTFSATLFNAGSCCEGMFYQCTSLQTAPPIIMGVNRTLGVNCFKDMFNQCSNLSTITFTYVPGIKSYPTYYTQNWVASVKQNGTFYMKDELYNQNVNSYMRGPNAIPTNWTVQRYVES